jgi:glutamine phosphoribosylpyrophosphate amidotransferase
MEAGINTMKLLEGAYSCITLVKGVGLVAFRDPHGIRPLVLGRRRNPDGTTDYCVASEDCAFGPIAFERVRPSHSRDICYSWCCCLCSVTACCSTLWCPPVSG